MSVYRHATADWGEILIEDGRDGRVFAKITDQRASGYHSITLPADERRAAAQALAGDRYRVVLISEYELTTDRPLEQAHEDLDRILDALGLDVTGRPYSAHECVTRDVLPAIERLRKQAAGEYGPADIRRASEQAWDEGHSAGIDCEPGGGDHNPYRAEPEPDEAAVEALAEHLQDTDDTNVARWGALSEVVRDGYRDQARRLIRRGVQVPSDA